MINVAAIRMHQFGVQFYQASLSASDIDKLVRFEVLSYGEQSQPVRGGRKKVPAPTKVNWDLLERRIAANEKAYQRQIIRRKIDESIGAGIVEDIEFRVAPRRLGPQLAQHSTAARDDADGRADPVLRNIYKASRKRELA